MEKVLWILIGILLNASSPVFPFASAKDYSVIEGALSPREASSSESESSLRFFLLTFRPKNPEEKFPLLVILHSAGETPEEYLELWEEEAAERHVMVLAPHLNRSYDPNDLAEFRQLLLRIQEKYPVDKGKIFLTGTSAGGLVAEWLAVRFPSLWRGAIFIASFPYEDLLQNPGKVTLPPFFWIHGEKDDQSPYPQVLEFFRRAKLSGLPGELWSDPEAGHEHKPEWHGRIWEWIRKTGDLT